MKRNIDDMVLWKTERKLFIPIFFILFDVVGNGNRRNGKWKERV